MRTADPAARQRIRHDMEEVGSDGFMGVPVDWHWIVIGGVSRPEHRRYVGMNIIEAAERHGSEVRWISIAIC
jgi:N-acyl-D-amino-acid deacylase